VCGKRLNSFCFSLGGPFSQFVTCLTEPEDNVEVDFIIDVDCVAAIAPSRVWQMRAHKVALKNFLHLLAIV
jgi:hypothetical protein